MIATIIRLSSLPSTIVHNSLVMYHAVYNNQFLSMMLRYVV